MRGVLGVASKGCGAPPDADTLSWGATFAALCEVSGLIVWVTDVGAGEVGASFCVNFMPLWPVLAIARVMGNISREGPLCGSTLPSSDILDVHVLSTCCRGDVAGVPGS